MKFDFSQKYDQLTPKNKKRFRDDLISQFDWNTKASFYNVINGSSSISLIEKNYIDNLFVEYFQRQIDSIATI